MSHKGHELTRLNTQIDTFIDSLAAYNKLRTRPREEKDYLFLKDFYHKFLADRNARADEVESAAYQKVLAQVKKIFPATTLWVLCMDGRVLAILVNGASAGVGSSIRVPGGILREFVRGKDGKYKLMEHSMFAMLLERALHSFSDKTIYEVFDSHVGCAARKAEEMTWGHMAGDAGLLADVVFKRRIAEATSKYVDEKFGGERKIVPIQTSFDPHAGFLYMGLETDKALEYARDHGDEYTQDVLDYLVGKKMVISSERLASDPTIQALFKKHAFKLDWKSNYIESAKLFWTGIGEMKEVVIPILEKLLVSIYPRLDSADKDAKDELHERAMLLLTNAFSGFLNNQQHGTAPSLDAPHNKHDQFQNYPYGVHREEGVKVSEGGYPPYQYSMFVVFSLDKKNLANNIELAASLVRSNRREGRVLDHSGMFKDANEFAQAPVPVVVQKIIRQQLSPDEWEQLAALDWNDLPQNWDSMSDEEFLMYLQTKMNMSIVAANAINDLRKKMAVLYDPTLATSAHLVEQYKVALPLMVSKSRRNHFIIPFVKLGFE